MANSLNNIRLNQPAKTSQRTKAVKGQVRNAGGGFSFKRDDANRFRNFLTIGSDGGTYSVTETELTAQHVKLVQKYIKNNGLDAVKDIVEVSDGGLAPRNTQALFALAIAFMSDDLEVKKAAKAALPFVARTSTHLFEFAQFVENNMGWGRAKTSAVASWYEEKSTNQLAYQAVKYRQRNGWTHRDLLRLAHPKDLNPTVVNFILGKSYDLVQAPEIIQAFHALQSATSEAQIVKLIEQHPNATWEMIPTEFHSSAKVWRSFFDTGRMGQTALLRNTKRLHGLGLFNDMKFVAAYANALSDPSNIEKGRLHPINYLNAYVAYAGEPRKNRYDYGSAGVGDANGKIVEALEKGYFSAYKNITPAEMRTMVALDVSGSMSMNAAGLNISCALLGGTFCQGISRTEPYSILRGFTNNFKELNIHPNDSLATVMKKTYDDNWGGTDCAIPTQWALSNKIEIDTFVIFTDSDTWSGWEHPFESLDRYRQGMGIASRLVVVAATAPKYTIANPNDAGSMDVSGFDSSAPKVIADFSAGRL